MQYQIIIATYNECLEWTKHLNPEHIIIYNKNEIEIPGTIQLKNVGREGETFLHHIIENYNNLPDYLLFVQGNPFDHMDEITPENFQQNINQLIESDIQDIQPLFTNITYEDSLINQFNLKEYYSLFFESIDNLSICKFSAGGQYIIPRNNILNRPLEFYIKIHKILYNSTIIDTHSAHTQYIAFDPNQIHGWCLERLFMYIFCKDIATSPKFLES